MIVFFRRIARRPRVEKSSSMREFGVAAKPAKEADHEESRKHASAQPCSSGIALKTFHHSVRCVTHRRTGGIKLGNAKPFWQAPPRSLTVRTGRITSKSSHCKNKFSLGRRQLEVGLFWASPNSEGARGGRISGTINISTRDFLQSSPVESPSGLSAGPVRLEKRGRWTNPGIVPTSRNSSLAAAQSLSGLGGIPPSAVSCGRRLLAKRLEPYRYYAEALGDVVTGVAAGKSHFPRSVGGGGGCLLPVVQIQAGIRTSVTVHEVHHSGRSRRNRESNEDVWIIRAKGAKGDTALLNADRSSLRNAGTVIRRSGRRRVADDRGSAI